MPRTSAARVSASSHGAIRGGRARAADGHRDDIGPPYWVIKWGDDYTERPLAFGRISLTSKQRSAKRFEEEPDAWHWLARWNPDCITLDDVRTVKIVRKK